MEASARGTDPPLFFSLLGQSLHLQEAAFQTLETLPTGSRTALLTVLLAGLSAAVGQCAVLFINRVKARRFLGSLLLSSAIYAFTYLFWTASVWLIARYVFGSVVTLGTVGRAVGLGHAPQLFSFLVFMPFFGVPVQVILSLWTLLAILTGTEVAANLLAWQALVCSLLGWVVLQLLQRTVGRPVVTAARWLRQRVSGTQLDTAFKNISRFTGGDEADAPTSERKRPDG